MDCPRALACAKRASYTEVRTVITDSPGLGNAAALRFSGSGIDEVSDNARNRVVLLFCECHEFDVYAVGDCHSMISGSWHTSTVRYTDLNVEPRHIARH